MRLCRKRLKPKNPLASGAWAPPVDLCETEDAIFVRVELPGVTADQIKIGSDQHQAANLG